MIGSYASEQDYMFRQVRFDVGADVGVEFETVENLTSSSDKIKGVPGISCAAVEYEFSGDLQAVDRETLHIKAVNPEEWLDAAYYEDISFGGRDVSSAFEELRRDNHTIILEHRVANMLGLNIGDEVAVKLYGSIARPTFSFKVVGFFGPKPPPASNPNYEWSWYWSYMHEDVYLSIMEEPYRRGRMLVRVAPDADDASIAEEIRNLQLINVLSVYSVTESLNQWLESPLAPRTARMFFSGVTVSTGLHQLGVVFAVLAASAGTALVTFVSLEERRKEVGVMSVRGLSFGQIAKVLLCENLAVVGFAVLLGAAMGIVTLHGNLCALSSTPTLHPRPTQQTWAAYTPIIHRMVFPSDSILTLAGCCILVLASAMIPTLFTTRRFIYEIERIVREA